MFLPLLYSIFALDLSNRLHTQQAPKAVGPSGDNRFDKRINKLDMIKRLTRPHDGRMLGGVCAGIGEYLGIDPTVVRIIYVLLSIGAIGTPIIVYLIPCLIIPES